MTTPSVAPLALAVGGSVAFLLAAVVTGMGWLWLTWAVVTAVFSGVALAWENWGKDPPSEGS